MNKTVLNAGYLLLVAGCSVPPQGTFDLGITNNTAVSLVECGNWHRISDDVIKSTCLVDNRNKAELRSLEIRAYDEKNSVIGRSLIGKVTIGEKVKINKSMTLGTTDIPVLMTLEASE